MRRLFDKIAEKKNNFGFFARNVFRQITCEMDAFFTLFKEKTYLGKETHMLHRLHANQ